MKPFLFIAAVCFCGCTVTRFTSGPVTIERRSFLQKVEFGEITISTNGMAKLKGYHNDGGNEALGVAVSSAVAAAINSAK